MKPITIEIGHLTINEILRMNIPCDGLKCSRESVKCIIGYDLNTLEVWNK